MRFMHMADVHLGAVPDAGCSWSRERSREIWESFRNAIADAEKEQVDLLLIAGDLFHRQPDPAELREVDHLFSSLKAARVVLIAGNHDYIQPGSPYRTFTWSRNVAFLQSPECECVRFPDIRTEVYGFSYNRQMIREPLYDSLHPVKDDMIHILLAHGGDENHIPISREKLKNSGFDYIALGHIHKPGILLRQKAVYSGCLEPIECSEIGKHGYILGEIRGKHVSTRFVPAAKREYHEVVIDCTQEDTTFSVLDCLEEEIERLGTEDMYRVVLEGKRDAGVRFDAAVLRGAGRVVDLKDNTSAAFDRELLCRRYQGQMIGRFIESFGQESGDELEKKALEYGLEALLGSRNET